METSIFLAKLFSLTFIVAGIGMMLNQKYYMEMAKSVAKNEGVLTVGGLLSLVMGLAIIQTHNVWSTEWPVIITLLGWISVIKGIVLLVAPGLMSDLVGSFKKKSQVVLLKGLVMSLLGLFLAFQGFTS